MINRTGRMAALFMVCGIVSGCSTIGLDDMFASDKQTLDESQIVANPTLAVPPDLSLRPPAQGAETPRQPVASQPVTTAPPNYGAPEPEPVQQQAVQQPAYPTPQPVPSQQAATAPQTATAPTTDPNDPYAKWGVSRYRADGTKKSQAELNEEMRQVKLKQKKAENPNYGTIWNLGNVWSDN